MSYRDEVLNAKCYCDVCMSNRKKYIHNFYDKNKNKMPTKKEKGFDREVKDYSSIARLGANAVNVASESINLLMKKHKDYGTKNISKTPGGSLNGLSVRLYDKVARLENLIGNNKKPENETLRDTFLDIMNYALIAILVLDGKWDKTER